MLLPLLVACLIYLLVETLDEQALEHLLGVDLSASRCLRL